MIRIYLRWIVIAVIRDCILPIFVKMDYKKVGEFTLKYVDGKTKPLFEFYECGEVRKVCFSLRHLILFFKSSYLFLKYELGIWTYDELVKFMVEKS